MATVEEARGWQVGRSLPQCLLHMLHNQISTDVNFLIHSPTDTDKVPARIAAHKFVLSARSPVFEAMFSESFSENSEDVKIVDAEEAAFKEILRYMYTDEVDLSGDNVLQISYLARKYILEGLINVCSEFLESKICVENVCDVLSHSVQFGEKKLVDQCLRLCESNTAGVVATNSFLNLNQTTLLRFLQHNGLHRGAEEAIFGACLKWAEKKCEETGKPKEDFRSVLGDCLYQIRFLQLEMNQFAALVGKSEMLTGEEKNSFLCYKQTEDESYLVKLRELGFNTISRNIVCPRPAIVNMGTVIKYSNERIRISVSTPVILSGIGVHSGPACFQHDISVKLTDETGAQLGEIQSSITSTQQCVISAHFADEIRLEPQKNYFIDSVPPRHPNCLHTGSSLSFIPPNTVLITTAIMNSGAFRRKAPQHLGYLQSIILQTFV